MKRLAHGPVVAKWWGWDGAQAHLMAELCWHLAFVTLYGTHFADEKTGSEHIPGDERYPW